MKRTILVLLAASLAACATTPKPVPEPIIQIVEVKVPGPALPCVPKELGPPPVYVDSDSVLKKAKDAAERFQLLFAGRMQREARLNEIEPVISSCPKG